MTVLAGDPPPRRRVRVWFGAHVLAEHIADADAADRYEQAMRRRFGGLRTTNEPVLTRAPRSTAPDPPDRHQPWD
jgi:hypothetical protein